MGIKSLLGWDGINKSVIRLLMGSLALLLLLMLTACGGGGGGSSGSSNNTGNNGGETPTPELKTGVFYLPLASEKLPIIQVNYTRSGQTASATTNASGQFNYNDGETITFKVLGKDYSIVAQAEVALDALLNQDADKFEKLSLMMVNVDADNDKQNGITLGSEPASIHSLDLNASMETFLTKLYDVLGKYPQALFSPSLGINLEAPQAEADTAGQAMPFVDVFRTARPFVELSSTNVSYDSNGWVTNIPDGSFARTKLFQGAHQYGLPSGTYTVLYDGQGTLQFGGTVLQSQQKISDQQYELQLQFQDSSEDKEANSLTVVIADTAVNNPIRNIRIIMPGGLCRDSTHTLDSPIDPQNSQDNVLLRVEQAVDCPDGLNYHSFVDLLAADRNRIIFNPDYLRHLSNFRLIRMMNFMEASPSYPCDDFEGGETPACIKSAIAWADRAKLDDAVWGGSSRITALQHKGVPVEVLAALINQLDIDPWFAMPHFADDEYMREFASYMATNLRDGLKVHLEYSNETWNPNFWAYHYVQLRGQELGLNTVPAAFQSDSTRDGNYFGRLRFYTQRALEMFNIWQTAYTNQGKSADGLVRILGSQQGDIVLTRQMLSHNNASQSIDAIAIAPYFFGCIDRAAEPCASAAMVLSEAQTVDDVFNVVNTGFTAPSTGDPSALSATQYKASLQAEEVRNHNLQLMTYEGGQHLTIMGSMGELPQDEKNRLRALFREANRDGRMKTAYLQQLQHWKSLHDQHGNATLFTLYTMPQTFYDFGNWGIKEYLTQPRASAPKYDAVMQFQESMGQCWWNGCAD